MVQALRRRPKPRGGTMTGATGGRNTGVSGGRGTARRRGRNTGVSGGVNPTGRLRGRRRRARPGKGLPPGTRYTPR